MVFLIFLACSIPAAAELQQIYGPYFAADQAHTSRLLIHNKRIDLQVPLKVYLLVGEGERVLIAAAILQPKESRAFELNAQLLRAARRSESAGGVLVEYDFFEKQAVDGSILVRKRDGSHYVVAMFRRDQIRGTVQEAVFATASPAARAFVALQNTSTFPRSVTIEAEGRHDGTSIRKVDIEPQTTQVIWLDAALARTGAHQGAAVRVTNSGGPGDVVAAGAVVDPNGAYAARIRFNDLAHGSHSRILRAQFLFLGPQDSDLGLPSGANYVSRCVVRNASDLERVIRPLVKWLDGPTMREARLPPQRLRPHEVRILDLTEAQNRGEIPAAFRFGVLEIPYDGPRSNCAAARSHYSTCNPSPHACPSAQHQGPSRYAEHMASEALSGWSG
ncbi:MAG TPA: hypothetical protein VEO54_27205 [Thermoanaerobaculia bacterium]|nr:hypothetical protein [Thermoanaerobaculia bacterium]